ncbi:hypothetical protein H8S90_13445 [Olivibacter sp. SDN3]|uniref:hypothetical protein n=1 Tax=Olivibacter sp. SDN3 TaxID=2764720 RepID=UPI001651A6C1|nr:hypothetical protein [Olivibacter sp. SDN3]QNL47825.1 hypothetical protein H8S90_13445 [Olivibacter sp. SDN3]
MDNLVLYYGKCILGSSIYAKVTIRDASDNQPVNIKKLLVSLEETMQREQIPGTHAVNSEDTVLFWSFFFT